MNPHFRNLALWAIIGLLVVALVMLFQQPGQRTPIRDISYSELLTQIDQGRVHDVTIAGNEIVGHFNDNRPFTTYAPDDANLVPHLQAKNVSISAKPNNEGGSFMMTLLLNALPLVAFLAVWIFLSRQMQGGAGRAMGFGKSKAKLLTETQGRVTFEDVAGVDEAKEDLQEIVEFL
ncbi:ATP-dependent metallopeptidase FtsH/Yme1/Tma family protein, partial [Methylocystis sp. B8]|uniref:ATP-dependent metallopeptidase FtsH/Yme1/Tma family protein n=1 Tax=Methylocystis sp. B8 TaxID=544938 RepID=UPI00126BAF01